MWQNHSGDSRRPGIFIDLYLGVFGVFSFPSVSMFGSVSRNGIRSNPLFMLMKNNWGGFRTCLEDGSQKYPISLRVLVFPVNGVHPLGLDLGTTNPLPLVDPSQFSRVKSKLTPSR